MAIENGNRNEAEDMLKKLEEQLRNIEADEMAKGHTCEELPPLGVGIRKTKLRVKTEMNSVRFYEDRRENVVKVGPY